MIRIQNCNIIHAREPILCHQVNCQNRMGSGVAKAISDRWPVVKMQYHEFCTGRQPESLLGEVQMVEINGVKSVANIFGQLHYGYDGRCYTDYAALDRAFAFLAQHTDLPMAFPYRFGCGLAGGDWDTVYALMEKHFAGHDITLYRL